MWNSCSKDREFPFILGEINPRGLLYDVVHIVNNVAFWVSKNLLNVHRFHVMLLTCMHTSNKGTQGNFGRVGYV